MGKIIQAIIPAVAFAAGYLIGGPLGGAIAVAVTSLASVLLFSPKVPKPDAAETQVRNPIAPRTKGYGIRRVYGTVVFYGSTSSGAAVDVIAYVDTRANSIVRTYLNDDQVTISGGTVNQLSDGSYKGGVVKAGFNLGQTPNTAHSAVVSALPGIWTSSHRGDGVVSGYLIKNTVKSKNFLDVYPQGDNVVMSLVISMTPCFDPRQPSHDINNPATWTATENPALHLLHLYTQESDFNYSYTNRILPVIDYWKAAADVCDEVVSGEARYRGAFLFDATAQPKEKEATIKEAFDGWTAVTGEGHIIIYAGKYYTPTVSIGPDEIIDYQHQSFVEEEERYNEITVSYYSSLHDYNEVDAQPWRDEADISERGRVNSTGIKPQVPSYKQARRLAKSFMARQNASDRGTVTTNYSGRMAEGQRFIDLEIVEAGTTIYSGPVEIISVTRNLETGGISFEYRRVDPNSWVWNPVTEDGYGAPVGNAATPDPLTAPTITTVTSAFDAVANTAVFTVNGTGPNRSDLTWFLRWKYTTDSVYNEQRYDDIAAGASVSIVTGTIPVNTSIDIGIAYANGAGQVSDWSNTVTTTADTNGDPPAAAGNVVLSEWNGSIKLTTATITRANIYRFKIYASDGVTLKRTIDVPTPYAEYTLSMATQDGVARDYKVTVEGVNNAGSGTVSSQLSISKPALAAPTGVSPTSGDYTASVSYTPTGGASGVIMFYSASSGFNPNTQGSVATYGNTGSLAIGNLTAGTYYFKLGSLDGWTANPSFLSLTSESSFTINIGGGGYDPGTGGGYDQELS